MSEPLRFSDVPALINIGQPLIISWSGSDGSFANLTLCEDRYDADSHVSNFVPVKILESATYPNKYQWTPTGTFDVNSGLLFRLTQGKLVAYSKDFSIQGTGPLKSYAKQSDSDATMTMSFVSDISIQSVSTPLAVPLSTSLAMSSSTISIISSPVPGSRGSPTSSSFLTTSVHHLRPLSAQGGESSFKSGLPLPAPTSTSETISSALKRPNSNASVPQSTIVALGVTVPLIVCLLMALGVLCMRRNRKRKYRSASLGTMLQRDNIDGRRANYPWNKEYAEIMSEGATVPNELPRIGLEERGTQKNIRDGY